MSLGSTVRVLQASLLLGSLALAALAPLACGSSDDAPAPSGSSSAAAPSRAASATPAGEPIAGEQLDRIQEAARAEGIAPAEWVHVISSPDPSRAVVHARLAADLPEEALDDYCDAANAAVASQLEPGQAIEIYVIQEDGVGSCN